MKQETIELINDAIENKRRLTIWDNTNKLYCFGIPWKLEGDNIFTKILFWEDGDIHSRPEGFFPLDENDGDTVRLSTPEEIERYQA